MKKVIYLFFLLYSVVLLAEGDVEKTEEPQPQKVLPEKKVVVATRGDVKIIEASENIRYLSQKIVKDYLFFYKHREKVALKQELSETLRYLNSDFRVIATTTKDSDTKDILEFLAYSKDQIEETLKETPDEEKAALMLDYSEILLEGADSIAAAHKYDFSKEEKMFMLTKKIEYLLQRVTKYYMAIHVGFDTFSNNEQMNESIAMLEEDVKQINAYPYPSSMQETRAAFDTSWKFNKSYFKSTKELFIPKLMMLSVADVEDIVAHIALYHSKNQ